MTIGWVMDSTGLFQSGRSQAGAPATLLIPRDWASFRSSILVRVARARAWGPSVPSRK
ncbi:hypothetical protein IFHNHDMJ_01675 [Synechococcus sp. CBW1107]|nr:hypothetical protein IFHNHDMJ_01675 [Synechococcus sp. CBW1107]